MTTISAEARNHRPRLDVTAQPVRSDATMAWILSCTLAEALGIGAAATAAVLARGSPSLELGAVVAAGAVEGTALGVLMGRQLHRRLPSLRVGAFTAVTVLFAVLGWGLGMGASMRGGDETAAPPFLWALVAAGGLGLVMGALLGAAQWLVLRRHARNAGRWITWSALGWVPAMMAIFAGAMVPDQGTPAWLVVVCGIAGGASGGALLGAVTAHVATTIEPSGKEAGARAP